MDDIKDRKAGCEFRTLVFTLVCKKTEIDGSQISKGIAGIGRNGQNRDMVHTAHFSHSNGGFEISSSANQDQKTLIFLVLQDVGGHFGGFQQIYILPSNGKQQFFKVIAEDRSESTGGPYIDRAVTVKIMKGSGKLFF